MALLTGSRNPRPARLALWLGALLLSAVILVIPGGARGVIMGNTQVAIDLTQPREAAAKAKWSDPDRVKVTPDGLGWGTPADQGSRDFWLETSEPIALGESWRPTFVVTVRAVIEQPANSGQLYVRYSPDAKHWSTWQPLPEVTRAGAVDQEFSSTVRVPYRERSPYEDLRMAYARREDVPWSSDEEAHVRDILCRDSKYFEKTLPFIGYVQFLYEGQLPGGRRLKGLKCDLGWTLSGAHQPPKDPRSRQGRSGPWHFKAP